MTSRIRDLSYVSSAETRRPAKRRHVTYFIVLEGERSIYFLIRILRYS